MKIELQLIKKTLSNKMNWTFYRQKYLVLLHNIATILQPEKIVNKKKNLRRAKIKLKKIAANLFLLIKNDQKLYFENIGRWHSFKFRNNISDNYVRVGESYKVEKYLNLTESDLVIDIGANLGFFSKFCIAKKCHIIAIEAERNIFAALKANCSNYNKIRFHNVAISDQNGAIKMASPSLSDLDSFSLIIDKNDFDKNSLNEVNCKTLDSLTNEEKISKIKLIKCDAEGAEPQVLIGAKETLKKTEYITIDCSEENLGKDTLVDCKKILEDANFKILKFGDNGNGRKLILAKNNQF